MTFKYNEMLEIYNLIETITKFKKEMKYKDENIHDMIEIYKIVKESQPYFFSNGELNLYYNKVKELIMACEEKLPRKFIIDSNPNFNYDKSDLIKKNNSEESLLNNIVLKTRKELLKSFSLNNPNEEIKKISFTNKCYKSSRIVKKICDDNDIKCYIVDIHPGFSKNANLCNGNCFHYFNIIENNNNYYLIDCTYRQFFRVKGNIMERIGIIDMPGCYPGIFMKMDKARLETAKKILKDGWIKLDEETLKHYLDGFAISYRNGVYYSKTKDYSYQTTYKTEDYIKFLKEKDNQINHEGKECLGYQRKLIHKVDF